MAVRTGCAAIWAPRPWWLALRLRFARARFLNVRGNLQLRRAQIDTELLCPPQQQQKKNNLADVALLFFEVNGERERREGGAGERRQGGGWGGREGEKFKIHTYNGSRHTTSRARRSRCCRSNGSFANSVRDIPKSCENCWSDNRDSRMCPGGILGCTGTGLPGTRCELVSPDGALCCRGIVIRLPRAGLTTPDGTNEVPDVDGCGGFAGVGNCF